MDIHVTQAKRTSTAPRDTQLPLLHITTEHLRAWRLAVDVLFSTATRAGDAFSASLEVFHCQRFLLCRGYLEGARYGRDAHRLDGCDLDHYVLYLPLQRGLAAGNGMRVRARDVVVLDLTQPAAFAMAGGEGLSLVIPRTALAHPTWQLHGLRLGRESPMGRLLASLLSSLATAAPQLTQDQLLHLGQPLVGVIGACLISAAAGRQVRASPTQGDLGRRARSYIERNLQRNDLTPTVLAKAMGTSRSQLYRAFERFGGVRHYLLQRRLRRYLQALGEPGNAGRRIGDLAYDHGFTDEAHLRKVFRKAFGLSPRAARTALQRGELACPDARVGEPPSMARWLRELASH